MVYSKLNPFSLCAKHDIQLEAKQIQTAFSKVLRNVLAK